MFTRASSRGVAAPVVPASLVRVGTAGWSLPAPCRPSFGEDGSNLARYASRFHGVEINSSFYRPHRASTYARWAESVPDEFLFSVKLPRTITHEQRLANIETLLDEFLAGVMHLGPKLGCLLVQLPPSLVFDRAVVATFLDVVRARHAGPLVLEPRHATWFTDDVDALLRAHRVAQVAADPARVAEAAVPGGSSEVVYYRLHGSPVMYRSSYDDTFLRALCGELERARRIARQVWCIFDNTTLGAATANALDVQQRLASATA